ncbi:hypothetical protein Cme02nite_45870 [Catellatospora methionotrophica]|uniref:Uncharacterized protein n=1 Tax=Catellatospora methionotrophica TaxID=121620 RepID=A0A8J3LKM5_9ACTN|nr:hypothetical protein [Catellatospora methionotrophica]GIG16255.1 hypothetical protein Cme02nite_45870 [Catellatospora methionotrophica]
MRQVIVRLGLAGMAVVHLWWGLWAYAAPRHFFSTFPGFGHHWTAAYPPYNEHLTADLGATFLTLAVLLAVPAIRYRRATARLALAGSITFNALHLGFHTLHHGTLTGIDLAGSLFTLVAGLGVPVALLLIAPKEGHLPHATSSGRAPS